MHQISPMLSKRMPLTTYRRLRYTARVHHMKNTYAGSTIHLSQQQKPTSPVFSLPITFRYQLQEILSPSGTVLSPPRI